MDTNTLIFPIVGSHFRPPAKTILSLLPSATNLSLEPEPDNPYDSNAVKVILHQNDLHSVLENFDPFSLEKLNTELLSCGSSISDLNQLTEPLHLGYLPASIKTSAGGPTNLQALSIISQPNWFATFTWLPDGRPAIQLTY